MLLHAKHDTCHPRSVSERGSASESRRPKIVRFYSRTNEKNIKPHYLNARTFFFLPDLFRKYHSSCRTTPKNILSRSIPRPPQLHHPGFKIDYKKKLNKTYLLLHKRYIHSTYGKTRFRSMRAERTVFINEKQADPCPFISAAPANSP